MLNSGIAANFIEIKGKLRHWKKKSTRKQRFFNVYFEITHFSFREITEKSIITTVIFNSSNIMDVVNYAKSQKNILSNRKNSALTPLSFISDNSKPKKIPSIGNINNG